MVNISSQALSSNSGAIGAATGLMQGLQAGYIKGRELSQQENLLRLQQEAGQRAEQGLDLERQRLGLVSGQQAFEQAEVQRRVTQQKTDSEIIGRAGELIANTGDSSAVDRFVAKHHARSAGTPFGGSAPNILDPRLRSAYKTSQVHQLDEATRGASPEVRQFLFDKFSAAAKESEGQRGRQHLADRASRMLKTWEKDSAELGDKPPSWVTDIPEMVINAIKEDPEAFDEEMLTGSLEMGGKAYSAWKGPRDQMRDLAERAKKALSNIQDLDPRIGAMASTDTMLMSLDLMAPEDFAKKLSWYAQGKVPVQSPSGGFIGADSPEEAQKLQSMFLVNAFLSSEHSALINEKTRSEIEENRARANYWNQGGARTAADGNPNPEDVTRMLMSEETRIRAEEDHAFKMAPMGRNSSPAVLRALRLPTPMTDDEIKAKARKRVGQSLSSAGVNPSIVDSITSGRFEGMASRTGQPMFDTLPQDEQQASKVRGLMQDVYSKGMTNEQAIQYLEAAGIDLDEQYMMSEELPKMLETMRIMQSSGIQIPNPR